MDQSQPALNAPWLRKATRIIHRGGLVAIPFERLFGIAGDAENADSIERVIAAKRRDATSPKQPISVIASDFSVLSRFMDGFPDLAKRLANRYWPGPLTILVPAAKGVPEALVSDSGLIGVRIPGPSPAADLARATSKILTATSANVTGNPDILCHETLRGLSMAEIDFIVEGRVAGPPGSTVVDGTGKTPRVLRHGAIALGPEE